MTPAAATDPQPPPAAVAGRVLYDGECSFCRRQVQTLQRQRGAELLDFAPAQGAIDACGGPVCQPSELGQGIRFIDPAGRVYVGVDALYQIGCRLPRWRWLSRLYHLPPARWLARAGYRIIAKVRHRL